MEFVVNDIKLDINPIQDERGGAGDETWHDYTLSKEDQKNI